MLREGTRAPAAIDSHVKTTERVLTVNLRARKNPSHRCSSPEAKMNPFRIVGVLFVVGDTVYLARSAVLCQAARCLCTHLKRRFSTIKYNTARVLFESEELFVYNHFFGCTSDILTVDIESIRSERASEATMA